MINLNKILRNIILFVILVGLVGCNWFDNDSTGKSSDVSYNYIYENLSKEVPVYEYNLIEVKSVYNLTNGTWSQGYNYTKRNLIGYKTEYYNGDRIGLKVGDKTINNPNVYVNKEKNTLSEWSFDIGQRNFEDPELGQGCREYEKQKKMCKETSILELIK